MVVAGVLPRVRGKIAPELPSSHLYHSHYNFLDTLYRPVFPTTNRTTKYTTPLTVTQEMQQVWSGCMLVETLAWKSIRSWFFCK